MVTLRKLSLIFLGLSVAQVSYGMNPNNNQNKFLALVAVATETYIKEFGNQIQKNFNEYDEQTTIEEEDHDSSKE